MIDFQLEGKKMTDSTRAQSHIKNRLEFSDDYGLNLDALWDELDNIEEPTSITLFDTDVMLDNLGQYGYDLLDTFEDAAKANHEILFEKL